jgi:hypothetical protein
MNQQGWNYREDGTLFRGENDVVTTEDGHTIIKDLENGIKHIASQRKLFPQSNSGSGQGQQGAAPPKATGDPNVDALIQKQLSDVERIKNLK